MPQFFRKSPCSLFPYERTDIVSIQEVTQQASWMITAFNLPEAWKKSEGEGVVVAVLDTGCQLDHHDLVDNLMQGWNTLSPGTPPKDGSSHGTHVAGIIAACNNEIGVVGVAPKAKILPIKVLDDHGNGILPNVSKGIMNALEQGADIMVMSLGSPRPLPQLYGAIQAASKKGVPIFVAAGNAGRTSEVYYPAAYPETIAVGAVDQAFQRAMFSNTGNNLDFMGPGVDILSTVPDNWYALMSGSSMATPFVAGVAALLLSYSRKNGGSPILNTVDDYREELKKQCFHITGEGSGDRFFEGYGIIDVGRLFGSEPQVSCPVLAIS